MAKKSFGKFLALATLSGAVAAGVSYFLKYKSFNKELDKDFHDFEGDDDEDFDGSLPHESCTPERTYVTLGESTCKYFIFGYDCICSTAGRFSNYICSKEKCRS